MPPCSYLLVHASLLTPRGLPVLSLAIPHCSVHSHASLLRSHCAYIIAHAPVLIPPCSFRCVLCSCPHRFSSVLSCPYVLAHNSVVIPSCSYLLHHTWLPMPHCSYLVAHTSLLIPHCPHQNRARNRRTTKQQHLLADGLHEHRMNFVTPWPPERTCTYLCEDNVCVARLRRNGWRRNHLHVCFILRH